MWVSWVKDTVAGDSRRWSQSPPLLLKSLTQRGQGAEPGSHSVSAELDTNRESRSHARICHVPLDLRPLRKSPACFIIIAIIARNISGDPFVPGTGHTPPKQDRVCVMHAGTRTESPHPRQGPGWRDILLSMAIRPQAQTSPALADEQMKAQRGCEALMATEGGREGRLQADKSQQDAVPQHSQRKHTVSTTHQGKPRPGAAGKSWAAGRDRPTYQRLSPTPNSPIHSAHLSDTHCSPK